MSSEYYETLRETIAKLAAADRSYRRFGAATHRYAFAPPAAIDFDVPDDYRDYVTQLSAGGVGPYYGLLVGARPIALGELRALPLSHLGCGYAALLLLDGPARGEVWIHAQGMVGPMLPSFTAYLLDWIDRVTRNEWLEGFVPEQACALPNALTAYLDQCERDRGLAAGTLDGDALREDLGRLGPGAVEIAAGASVLYAEDDAVDPCVNCARLLERLAAQGLRRDVVREGTASPSRVVTAPS